ncbi:MAG: aminotransferase class I/II-fold pyridoxal phosphate-dependent enzyme, partial [Alphaproteobacteria bacterium]|nr:aminotransferase class I/II-fold pyridoxal phosphate-dependent enzyme [Alphaproteobacteria bacterium]
MASQWTSLSLPVRGLAMSATVASQATCEQRAAEGLPVYRFGLGQSPFPVPDAVVAALREHAARKDYLPVEGLPALRAEVSRYLQRRIGVDYPAKGVLVGPGSKELMFLLQVCYYGELVIPTPAWVSYAPQATLVGRWPTLVPPDRPAAWRTTPELLSATCAADPDRP